MGWITGTKLGRSEGAWGCRTGPADGASVVCGKGRARMIGDGIGFARRAAELQDKYERPVVLVPNHPDHAGGPA
eukprot:4071685-Pyramimonas_sp.AAC.1